VTANSNRASGRATRASHQARSGLGHAAGIPDATLITADASKVTPLEFMDAIGMSSPEKRAKRQAELRAQCIRAIEGGHLYGWPGLLVAECRAIIAERDKPELKRTGTGDWW
jgi:hypothetical protein